VTDNSLNSDLFSSTRFGDLEMANRIVMAPLTRSRASDAGLVHDIHATYYAQRASAGLIIAEATNISPQARGYAMTPGIWSKDQVVAWKKVTDAVHAAGGKIICQLWHVGRYSHADLQPGGQAPVAPSAIRAEGVTTTNTDTIEVSMPRALETAEIPGLIADYVRAAQNAKDAGFDGVEVHSANCYLLEQFLRDSTNVRADQYGGSIENRCRLVLEIVAAVLDVWNAGQVGIRLSPVTTGVGNTPLDSDVMATYGYLIRALNRFGLAYLHMVEGVTGGPRDVPPGIDLDVLRALFQGAYIGNNGYDLPLAMKRRAAAKVDAVAFGRPFIGNPDLVHRFRHGLELYDAPKAAYYGGGAKGLTDFPTAA
jgi:N-ethylmaleimide reductase